MVPLRPMMMEIEHADVTRRCSDKLVIRIQRSIVVPAVELSQVAV